MRHGPLRMRSINCIQNFKNLHGILTEISLFKKYKKKSEFSNLLFDLAHISQMICIHFVLESLENQLLNRTYYVYEP